MHLDFAGPFQGMSFLVAVDADSKWPEVFPLVSTTASKTIEVLHHQQNSDLTLTHRLANFLWTYRSTPHATTGVSPSSLFLRRHMRTRFDMMRPDPAVTVNQQQSRQKEAHDRRARCREFLVGQSVMVRNLRPGPGWIPGVIVECLGPVSYLVETSDHLL